LARISDRTCSRSTWSRKSADMVLATIAVERGEPERVGRPTGGTGRRSSIGCSGSRRDTRGPTDRSSRTKYRPLSVPRTLRRSLAPVSASTTNWSRGRDGRLGNRTLCQLGYSRRGGRFNPLDPCPKRGRGATMAFEV
jgi:hypothetical protein